MIDDEAITRNMIYLGDCSTIAVSVLASDLELLKLGACCLF